MQTRLLSLGLGIIFLAATPVAAQEASSGFVGGLGGLTFGTVASGTVAGRAGVRIAPGIHLIGEGGYLRNVLPGEIRDDFDAIVDLVELEYGVPLTVEVSVPSTYGFGGVRWSPEGGSVAPFVEGGLGVARISLSIDKAEALGISFKGTLEDEIGTDDFNATKLLIAVGGGVTARVSPSVAVDFGFRFVRIATEDPAINTGVVYGAVNLGF